ncbi:MAG: hypothetical protein COB53_10380 [Elusimicrobia bacterium]|nr:MAG: hypothetical protein COB53_10380 [Elusimicrobiota bacterium]
MAVFRDATEADLDALCAIEDIGWSRAQFKSELGNGLFVAGSVEGFAALRTVGDEAQLYMIGVASRKRRSGLGGIILKECFRRSKAFGCVKMTLEVSAANTAAKALYESGGFCVVGHRTKYYNDGADALLMDASI